MTLYIGLDEASANSGRVSPASDIESGTIHRICLFFFFGLTLAENAVIPGYTKVEPLVDDNDDDRASKQ